ncbi:hypothetical protein FQR65_LT13242 [Abscondita terminalis]|nr:hypothetical protein FQR65_LT13242 [Abscondita terminalis]
MPKHTINLTLGDNCNTSNENEGECVEIYDCPTLLKLFINPAPDAVEYLNSFKCEITDQSYKVCCGNVTVKEKPTTFKKQISNRRYCGYQHADDYIGNTNDTSIDEFPWVAAILGVNKKTGKERIMCHGAVIDQRHVVTAAQCVSKLVLNIYNISKVRLGEFHLLNKTDCVKVFGDDQDCSETTEEEIENFVIHPHFHFNLGLYDIAVIRLKTQIGYSDYIRPICLPRSNTKVEYGTLLYTTGWGVTEYRGNSSTIKKRILTDLVSNEDCEDIIRKHQTLSRKYTYLHTCTVDHLSNKAVSCNGDSGAPVMLSVNSQWELNGIVSHGARCGMGLPNFNTNYLSWTHRPLQRLDVTPNMDTTPNSLYGHNAQLGHIAQFALWTQRPTWTHRPISFMDTTPNLDTSPNSLYGHNAQLGHIAQFALWTQRPTWTHRPIRFMDTTPNLDTSPNSLYGHNAQLGHIAQFALWTQRPTWTHRPIRFMDTTPNLDTSPNSLYGHNAQLGHIAQFALWTQRPTWTHRPIRFMDTTPNLDTSPNSLYGHNAQLGHIAQFALWTQRPTWTHRPIRFMDTTPNLDTSPNSLYGHNAQLGHIAQFALWTQRPTWTHRPISFMDTTPNLDTSPNSLYGHNAQLGHIAQFALWTQRPTWTHRPISFMDTTPNLDTSPNSLYGHNAQLGHIAQFALWTQRPTWTHRPIRFMDTTPNLDTSPN